MKLIKRKSNRKIKKTRKNKNKKTRKNKKFNNKGKGPGMSQPIMEIVPLPNFNSQTQLTLFGSLYVVQFSLNINNTLRNYVFFGEEHRTIYTTNGKVRDSFVYDKLYALINIIKKNKFQVKLDISLFKEYLLQLEYNETEMYLIEYIALLASETNECIDIFNEMPFGDKFLYTNYSFGNYKSIMQNVDFLLHSCSKPYSELEIDKHVYNDTRHLKLIDSADCKELYPKLRYHASDIRFIKLEISDFINFEDWNEDIPTVVNIRQNKQMCIDYIESVFNEDEESAIAKIVEILKYIESIDPDIHKNNAEIIETSIYAFMLIRKQLKKSIFFGYKDRFIHIFRFNMESTNALIHMYLIYMPRFIEHMMITCLAMNLYSMFRMFIVEWDNKARGLLDKSCLEINYPKTVINFAGMDHSKWIFEFIMHYFELRPDQYQVQDNSDSKLIKPITINVNAL